MPKGAGDFQKIQISELSACGNSGATPMEQLSSKISVLPTS
jgi:hypothetical protein